MGAHSSVVWRSEGALSSLPSCRSLLPSISVLHCAALVPRLPGWSDVRPAASRRLGTLDRWCSSRPRRNLALSLWQNRRQEESHAHSHSHNLSPSPLTFPDLASRHLHPSTCNLQREPCNGRGQTVRGASPTPSSTARESLSRAQVERDAMDDTGYDQPEIVSTHTYARNINNTRACTYT